MMHGAGVLVDKKSELTCPGCGAGLHAFDDDIAGTGGARYTPAELNDRLGSADVLFLHAATTGVTGSGPTLTCPVEHSASGEDWVAAGGGPQIGPIAIGNDGAYSSSIAPSTASTGARRSAYDASRSG